MKEAFRQLAEQCTSGSTFQLTPEFIRKVGALLVDAKKESLFDKDYLTDLQTLFEVLNSKTVRQLRDPNVMYNLQQLIDAAKLTLDQKLSHEFGYSVSSLAAQVTSKDRQHLPNILKTQDDEIGVINAVGDGNCGPRAVIQSMLIQGILKGGDTQVFVHQYLQQIYDERSAEKDIVDVGLYDITEHNALSEDVIRTSVERFLGDYPTMNSDNLDELINGYFGITTPLRALYDHVIYVLAGCLRFDLCDYIRSAVDEKELGQKLPGAVLITENLDQLGEEVDMSDSFGYLAEKGFGLNMDGNEPFGDFTLTHLTSYPASLHNLDLHQRFEFEPPKIEISIYRSGSHFMSLLHTDTDRLDDFLRESFQESPSSVRSTSNGYTSDLIKRYKAGFFNIKEEDKIAVKNIDSASAKPGESDENFAKRLQEAEFRAAGYHKRNMRG